MITLFFYAYRRAAELDTNGADMSLEDPYPMELTGYEPRDEFAPYWLLTGNPFSGGCTLDGMPIPCSDARDRMESGSAAKEFLLHDSQGFIRLIIPIVPLGAGLFGYAEPVSARRFEGNVIVNTELRTFSHAQLGGQQLSDCLRDKLRQFFPKMKVRDKEYSPVDDARFKSGIPLWARIGGKLPGAVSPRAITLGLYDIYYDSSVNLSGGKNDALQVIIEELSHTVQFLQLWESLPNNELREKQTGNGNPTYGAAQLEWKGHYAYHYVKGAGYDNMVEKWAKQNVARIMEALVKDPQIQKDGNLCGFDMLNYTIDYPK